MLKSERERERERTATLCCSSPSCLLSPTLVSLLSPPLLSLRLCLCLVRCGLRVGVGAGREGGGGGGSGRREDGGLGADRGTPHRSCCWKLFLSLGKSSLLLSYGRHMERKNCEHSLDKKTCFLSPPCVCVSCFLFSISPPPPHSPKRGRSVLGLIVIDGGLYFHPPLPPLPPFWPPPRVATCAKRKGRKEKENSQYFLFSRTRKKATL